MTGPIQIMEQASGEPERVYAFTSHICDLSMTIYSWASGHADEGWVITRGPGAFIASVRLDDGMVHSKHLWVEWPDEPLRHMATALGLDPKWTVPAGPQPGLDRMRPVGDVARDVVRRMRGPS